MFPGGSAAIHTWPPQSPMSPSSAPRSTPGLSDRTPSASAAAGLGCESDRRARAHGAWYLRDGDEQMGAGTDVGILRDESAIDRDRRQLNLQPPAVRHTFACVAGHVDEHSLDAFRVHIDFDRRRGPRKYQLDVVSRDPLQHALQIAEYTADGDRFEGAHLRVAVHAELSQKARGARDLTKQVLTLVPQDRVGADRGQPLLATLRDVAEQVIAGHRDFRCQPSDGFHALGPPELIFDGAQTRDVFRDELNRSDWRRVRPATGRRHGRDLCSSTWSRPVLSFPC